MSLHCTCEVYFCLVGEDFESDLLEIGLSPTKFRRKANPIPKSSRWIHSSGKVQREFVDIAELAAKLILALEPHTASIIEAKRRHQLTACLQVVITLAADESESTPAIGFESSVIDFLSRVGASIDIDLYRAAE